MTTLSTRHFDTLEYVKQAKKLGTSEELAELQARKIEEAIDIAIIQTKEALKAEELVTKTDLKREIAEAKNQIILWVAGMFVASGLIQHFFK